MVERHVTIRIIGATLIWLGVVILVTLAIALAVEGW